jgi:hypothetical protein
MTEHTEAVKPLPCIACGKVPNAVFDGERQPYGATTFYSQGHYGSTVFDPMRGSISITVNVCDDCLRSREQRVLLVTKDTRTTYEYAPWSAAGGSE